MSCDWGVKHVLRPDTDSSSPAVHPLCPPTVRASRPAVSSRWVGASPCAPDLDQRRIQSIAVALPRAMWPAWSDRLLLDLRKTAVARMTLSCATLLAGGTVKPVAAERLLGEAITPNALNHRLWVLRSFAYWQSICVGLIRLSDYLDSFGAPIDYQRRRHLDYSELLPADSWQQICTQVGDSRGESRHAIPLRASCTTPCLAVSAWLPGSGRASGKPRTEFETRAMGQETRDREQGFHLSRRAEGDYELSILRERSAARATVTGWLSKVMIRPVRVLGSRATPSWMNSERRS